MLVVCGYSMMKFVFNSSSSSDPYSSSPSSPYYSSSTSSSERSSDEKLSVSLDSNCSKASYSYLSWDFLKASIIMASIRFRRKNYPTIIIAKQYMAPIIGVSRSMVLTI